MSAIKVIYYLIIGDNAMMEPATWFGIKLVWRKESRTFDSTKALSYSLSWTLATEVYVMDTAKEIVSLINFSPKLVNLLKGNERKP